MNTLASFSGEVTREMDFAGGTVIHINVFAIAALIGLIAAVVWVIKKKR